jgi:hypothetical protein
MSPVPATGLVLVVASFFEKEEFKNRLFTDHDLEERINAMAAKIGPKTYKVYPQAGPRRRKRIPLDVERRSIDVYLLIWNTFDEKERDFMLAHELARDLSDESAFNRGCPFVAIAIICAGVVATINLWSILGLQAGGLLLGFLVARALEQRQVVRADAKALETTRDYSAARKYVGWHSDLYRWYHGDFGKRRLDALRNSAAKLGIA